MTETRPDIWAFQGRLTRRLGLGAGISLLLGLGMLLFRTPFWNGLAFQFIAWALIDLLIALAGSTTARRRKAARAEEPAEAQVWGEARRLERILWVNTALDVVYLLAGLLVARFPGASDPLWLGTGLGILAQGAFLFVFDLIHASQIRNLFPRRNP